MSEGTKLLLVFTLFSAAGGQNSVQITPEDTVTAEIGQRVSDFSCRINVESRFFMKGGKVHWVRPDGEEINENAVVNPQFTDRYNVSLNENVQDFALYSLVIFAVQDADHGEWQCMAVDSSGVVFQDKQTLNLLVDVKEFSITLGKEGPFTNQHTDGIQLDEGSYEVFCLAKGSNPAAVISIDHNAEHIQSTNNTSLIDLPMRVPAYEVTAKATVHLQSGNSVTLVRCEATVPTVLPGLFPAKTVEIAVNVISHEPIIECNNKTTSKGDRHVQAICSISFTQKYKDVTLEFGDTNTIIPLGGDENGDIILQTKDHNSTAVEVTIDVYEMKDEHFQHVLYLNVLGHDNKEYRAPLVFINEGLNSGSTAIVGSVFVELICVTALFTLVLFLYP